jgi:hypothetical protein
MENCEVTEYDLVSAIDWAKKEDKDVRIHERGDFYKNGKLDTKYLTAWKKALKIVKDGPWTWGYTHIYSKLIASLSNGKVSVYASVHSEADVKAAKRKGFKLFAYVLKDKKYRPNGKKSNKDYPTRVNIPILGDTLVCPEQRLGKDKVTCEKCRWCIEGKGNVAFLTSR